MTPNYERPAFSGTNFKAQTKPKVAAKVLKRRAVVRMDRTEKEKVRQRDKEACRVCFRKTRDVHERVFKSRGGVASLQNSMCACRTCHPFLQEHGIQVLGPTCHGPLEFVMNEGFTKRQLRHPVSPQTQKRNEWFVWCNLIS